MVRSIVDRRCLCLGPRYGDPLHRIGLRIWRSHAILNDQPPTGDPDDPMRTGGGCSGSEGVRRATTSDQHLHHQHTALKDGHGALVMTYINSRRYRVVDLSAGPCPPSVRPNGASTQARGTRHRHVRTCSPRIYLGEFPGQSRPRRYDDTSGKLGRLVAGDDVSPRVCCHSACPPFEPPDPSERFIPWHLPRGPHSRKDEYLVPETV